MWDCPSHVQLCDPCEPVIVVIKTVNLHGRPSLTVFPLTRVWGPLAAQSGVLHYFEKAELNVKRYWTILGLLQFPEMCATMSTNTVCELNVCITVFLQFLIALRKRRWMRCPTVGIESGMFALRECRFRSTNLVHTWPCWFSARGSVNEFRSMRAENFVILEVIC